MILKACFDIPAVSASRNFLLRCVCPLLVFFTLDCIVALPDIKLPPSLIFYNNTNIWVNTPKHVTLQCKAHGVPLPRLKWLKNGKDVFPSTNKMGRYVASGNNLRIHFMSDEEDGAYQCMAHNDHGATLSPPVHVRQARLEIPPKDTGTLSPFEGQPLTLKCGKSASLPDSSISWKVEVDDPDFSNEFQKPVVLNDRVQMDDDGNLHFSHVLLNDSSGEASSHKCFIRNSILDRIYGGSYFRITVQKRKPIKQSTPQLMFSSHSPVVVLEGSSVTLRCFFSGYPLPAVVWRRVDDEGNKKHFAVSPTHGEATMHEVRLSDAGRYICEAGNDMGSNSKIIEVVVHAAPEFSSPYDAPQDVNATEGDDVVVRCSSRAIPPANITWLRDGKPLEELPHKYHLSSDSKTLTIKKVCKSCPYGASDLMVVQCISKNEHGSLWGTGYINVLEKTKITVPPQSVEVSALVSQLSFNCSGMSDLSTPIKILWSRIMDRPVLLRSYNSLQLSPYNETLSIQILNSSLLENFLGNYSCQVTNGYSSEEKSFTISLPVHESKTEYVVVKEPERYRMVYAVALLLIFLLLLLLMLVFVCLKNRRCAVYMVDEKERECGNEPEKELEINGFLVYNRPERQLTRDSRLSLISSGISLGNASLSEYGDEAGRYDEDGSFIGNYGVEYK